MRRSALITIAITLLAFAPALAQENQKPDDRSLLRGENAPPNVFLLLDSAATMTHDPSNDHLYLSNADDPASKLAIAKRVMRTFVANFEFNMGFTYFEQNEMTIGHINFLYEVAPAGSYDTDGDGVDDFTQTGGLLDGTPIYGEVRLGIQPPPSTKAGAFVPTGNQWNRYGRDGGLPFAVWNPDGTNTGTPGSPKNADTRILSYLLDDIGDPKTKDEAPYYYPAFDWSALPGHLQAGVTGTNGSTDWKSIATTNYGLDTSDQSWRVQLRNRVLCDLYGSQGLSDLGVGVGGCGQPGYIHSGSRKLLVIEEKKQKYEGSGWVDIGGVSKRTLIRWVRPFVLYDHSLTETEGAVGPETITALDWKDTQCKGYLSPDEFLYDNFEPLVVPSKPDPVTGATIDKRQEILSYLEPQALGILYFIKPTGNDFHPKAQEDFIPFTETVLAGGRRTLKSSLVDLAAFLKQSNFAEWPDPLKQCRDTFVVIVTDGHETCQAFDATCNMADLPAGVPIYVVYFGDDPASLYDKDGDNVVECMATDSGNDDGYFEVGDEEALFQALQAIGEDIEERTRGFASPIVPSVETTTEQTAYISTFTPMDGRSEWRGHVRAYPIDPATGMILNLRDDGSPNPNSAHWDAGDLLGARDQSSRSMFFGMPQTSTPGFPGLRRSLVYPSDAVDRAFLGGRIFAPDAWADTAEEQEKLTGVINFTRGVMMVRDSSTDPPTITTHGRDPEVYGWCGSTGDVGYDTPFVQCDPADLLGVEKLGDPFHTTPQLIGPPRCYPCWLHNLHNYRDDESSPEADGFFDSYKHRRQVLFFGSNDGALHAIDAGLWDTDGTTDVDPRYDAGSGRELFAWVPSAVMSSLDELAYGTNHVWTVDGTPTVADVFIDREFTAAAGPSTGREWRTLLLFGQRRGGRSIVALDVTNPDGTSPPNGDVTAEAPSDVAGRDPKCMVNKDAAGCGGVEWPQFRWEFTDTSDEDLNGAPDLGNTWSRPVVIFVHADDGAGVRSRSIAVFGGGFVRRAFEGTTPMSGNFVYGIDVETMEILFKYRTHGMVAGDVAALDLNINGYPEALYWGDTEGYLYRMSIPNDPVSNPTFIDSSTGRISNWTPHELFYNTDNRPFFMRPALVPIAAGSSASEIVLAIGTGDRDNIFRSNLADDSATATPPNRFYVIADRPFDALGAPRTMNETHLYGPIYPTSALASNDSYFSTTSGWFLQLDDGDALTAEREKVNTPAVVLNMNVIFSTFTPGIGVDVVPGEDEDDPATCRRRGDAKTYIVNLYNADPPEGEEDRFIQHDETQTAMATEPVIYVGADGKIHVIQVLDNLQMEEPVGAVDVPVRVLSWKEE